MPEEKLLTLLTKYKWLQWLKLETLADREMKRRNEG
jgi:hypothetical protein